MAPVATRRISLYMATRALKRTATLKCRSAARRRLLNCIDTATEAPGHPAVRGGSFGGA